MIRILSTIILVCAFLGSTEANAAKRVALVIGNSAYEHATPLANPKNDASDMTEKLEGMGFEVTSGLDLDLVEMRKTVRKFIRSLEGADMALFFYAGHGLQVNGSNYMAPVDAQLARYDDLDFEALPMDLVLASMERNTKVNLVFLDACRDNPLARNLARSMGTRSGSVGRGLAKLGSGVGSLISFATQPGNVALDGNGRNSPFTTALLRHLGTPGQDVTRDLVYVRRDVLEQTNGKQVPWDNSSLTGEVILVPKAEERQQTPNQATKTPSAEGAKSQLELAYWNSIKDLEDKSFFEAYLQQFPDGVFAGLAKLKISVIEKRAQAETQSAQAAEIKAEAEAKETDEEKLVGESELAKEKEQPEGDGPIDVDAGTIKDVQLALSTLGHDPGPADGQYGPRTRSAISAARKSLDLPPGEHIDLALLRQLPDADWLETLDSERARQYKLSDVPENADPRLRKAIEALSSYEIKFGYFGGKLYVAVLDWGRGWQMAKSLSEKAGGHLVTLSSKDENNFVYRLFASDDRFLSTIRDGQRKGPHIGLYQKEGSREPNGGWAWVTGEPFRYKNWSRWQPNNYGGDERFASFHTYGSLEPGELQLPIRWDDNAAKSSVRGFIVEIE